MKRLSIGKPSRFASFLSAGCAVATTLSLVPSAQAATTYYVAPAGAATAACRHDDPCDLATGAATATAGDFVVLMDGTYQDQSLRPANSGTASAWLTFQADTGAVPILDGKNSDPKAVGVDSETGVYMRFVGIVARNWSTGFTNKWIGSNADGTTTDFSANGNWQYINCISEGNTRNGFAFNSSKGILMRENIAAHNGTSTTSSWSSGFQLFAVQGTASDNIVERNVSFENTDNQKHSDGSGFIVDTQVTGVAFINNLAFLNGGSGIRLTDSKNISIINNTFYHNGRDTSAKDPNYPAEIYFTDGTGSSLNLTMINNVGIGSGTTQDPTKAWTTDKGTISIDASNKNSGTFAGADGTNPDFRPASGSTLLDQGTSSGAPATDIGFDPKCITKGKPTDIAVPSWSAYSIDYTYIKSLGGVGKCWKPGTRPAPTGGKIDIGAYELGATVAPTGTGGALPPPPAGSGGATGTDGGGGPGSGGAPGTGGSGGGAGSKDASAGGAPGSGGAAGGSSGNGGSAGGAGSGNGGTASGGSSGQGGATLGGSSGRGGATLGGSSGNGGQSGGSGGNSSSGNGGNSSGGASGQGGSSASGGSSGKGGGSGTSSQGSTSAQQGCACQLGGPSNGSALFFTLLAGLVAIRLRTCSRSRGR